MNFIFNVLGGISVWLTNQTEISAAKNSRFACSLDPNNFAFAAKSSDTQKVDFVNELWHLDSEIRKPRSSRRRLRLQKQFEVFLIELLKVPKVSISLRTQMVWSSVSPTIARDSRRKINTVNHGAWRCLESSAHESCVMIDEQAITVRFSDGNLNVLNILR